MALSAMAQRILRDPADALQWLRQCGVQRLETDSRRVQPGDAFVAWPGAAHEGRRFMAQAFQAGAVACLVDAQGLEAFPEALDERVAGLADLKRHLGDVAAAWADHPSRSMEVVAFTGTNGKTSSAWWMAQASSLLGKTSGLVGTLGIGKPPVGGQAGTLESSGLTTPDPVTLQQALARMKAQGMLRCAMEASSIGLAEHRLQGMAITVAVLTNFTQDHLDYHGTLDAYWAAKRSLFDWPTLRSVVINIDDPRGHALAAEWRRSEPALWTVGTQGDARLKAADVRLGDDGIAFEILEQGGDRASVKVPFIGHYNIVNLLGVVAALRALGHPLSLIVRVLGQLTPVPGRLERCSVGVGEPLAVVDYAHTPDALDKALKALRPVAQARGGALWCVFGCGGDRDRSKRAPMGAMAAGGADHIVLTSDNPRTEDPVRIIRDIRAADLGDDGRDGMTPTVVEEPDRARAVARALGQAQAADVVLVAGKGHEDYQEIAGVRHPQRDHDLIAQALQLRRASQGFMTLDQVARFIPGGRLVGAASLPIARVHTDTRTLQPGDLYVALRGERFDGHDFLAQARQAGAVAALAEHGLDPQTMPGVEVPDSLQALQALAQAWRAQLQMPVVAVTGSNGKTTTTQMIASILRAWLGDAAAATRGNLNNHIGVPLTVLALRGGPDGAAHRAAVIELGMNHPGEIAQLAAIAQPTVALVNNAQREHQEFMGTVEAVARENGSVLLSLPPGGAAVFPAQDEYAPLWAAMAGGAKLWRFAWHRVAGAAGGALDHAAPAEVQGWAEDRGDHWALRLNTPLGSIDTTLVLPGEHNVHNAMAAAACALAAGAPLHAVAQGLADFRGVQGRSRRIVAQRGGRPITLVDDSYNANPDSVRAAIDLLAELPGPRALILGDMGEVGQQGPAFHEEVGQYAAQRGLEHLWCSGALTEHAVHAASAVRAAQAATAGSARHFESVPALIEALDQLPPVASILVKGSRFMRMERVVQALHPTEREGH